MKSLRRLLEIGGPGLDKETKLRLPDDILEDAGSSADDLLEMLFLKNGFYAFESALHVRPALSTSAEIGLVDWNSLDCWKSAYDGMADDYVFFAEDIFGGQFAMSSGKIFYFDPETGKEEILGASLDTWAEMLLQDYETLTGFPLAHDWQARCGAIPRGKRLVPRIPFVLGGDFTTDNLYLLDALKSMRMRGSIATQLRDLPDGAEIVFEAVD